MNNLGDVPNLPCSSGLKIAHLNIQSILGKMDDLNLLLKDKPFDIFTISETWLHANILDSEIQIPGYSFVRQDRTNKTGGGSVIYIRDGIPYRVRSDLASIAESCLIEVNCANCKKVFILSVYRPPGPLNDDIILNLDSALSFIPTNAQFVLLGDFNVNFQDGRFSTQLNRSKSSLDLQIPIIWSSLFMLNQLEWLRARQL